jgi:hypothetical protein
MWNAEEPVTPERPDLIFVSGSLNATPLAEREGILARLLEHQSRLGIIANFWRYDPRLPKESSDIPLFDSSPEETLGRIDPTVFKRILRADYLWHDYTLGAVRWP